MGLFDFLGGGQAQMPGQAQQPGFMQKLLAPEVALPMAAALMGGQGNAANLGNAFAAGGQGMAQQRATAQTNMTGKWLRQQDPKYAEMLDNGFQPGEVYKLYTEERQSLKPTASLQEYEFAKQQGYGGSFMDYQIDQKKAGATSVNVTNGGGKYGTIPQGFELVEGPNGATMRAIPGGPEDTSKKDALSQGQADVATRVVTSAAQRAREAAKQRNFGHVGQGAVSMMPWTDSAEVARQVDVMKSTAKVENLTAMRAASPTGGALGSVTEKEAEMLAAKSGALDPSSPTFQRDLDDYELTLLQVVHGPDVGAQIFAQTRQGGQAVGGQPSQQPAGNSTSSGVQWKVLP